MTELFPTSKMGDIFRRMSNIAEEANKRPDDYIGDDGFVHCAKCHGRKQRYIDTKTLGLGTIKVWCACPCLAAKAKAEEEAKRARKEREKREQENRIMAYSLRQEYMREEMIRSASFDIFFSKVFTGENDNAASRRLYKIATRYVEMFDLMLKDEKGMLFFGPTGTGKTFTAACIANALLDKGVPVIMTSLSKLTDAIDFGDNTKSATAIIQKINKADLLILDDLGVERASSFAMEKQYEFINGRYEAKKPIIFTTNLTKDQLLKTPNIDLQRVYSRAFEKCHLISFDGPDLRRERAKELYASMTQLLEGD